MSESASGDVKESARGWLGIGHVHRALWMGRELFRVARPDRKGATRFVHQFHSRGSLRIQIEVLSEDHLAHRLQALNAEA